MRTLRIGVVVWLMCAGLAAAQTPPQLIPFSGTADVSGQSGAVQLTLAIYEEQTEGVPLWVEIQSVTTGPQGAFTVLLGATTPERALADLFTTGQPRWIGVQVAGQAEQPRSLLASVPFALKAGDANTIGGLPASAFLLSESGEGGLSTSAGDSLSTATGPATDRDGLSSGLGDQIILDDLIVDGSACIGFDCVNGESFGFDTIRIKENNLRIRAMDTSNSASFPTNDWQITFNDSSNGGQNKFSIDDIDGGRTPFTLEAGAPSHSLYVDDGGRLGLGTSTPVVDVHIKSGNTPTLRLEQDGSSGFTPQTWDVAGNEANFFVRDATNGSTLPFRIQPGASSNEIYIANNDEIGIGTASPAARFHIENTVGDDVDDFVVTADGRVGLGTTSPSNTLHVRQASAGGAVANGTSALVVEHDSDTSIEILSPNAVIGRLLFSDQGGTGAGRISYNHSNDEMFFQTNSTMRMSIDNVGNVVISGMLTQSGSPSDARFKKNIRTIDSPLDKVMQLRGVEFDWRRDEF